MNYNQNSKISQLSLNSLIIGIDIGSNYHFARAFNWRGIELDKVLKFENTLTGFQKLLSWLNSIKLKYNLNNTLIGIEPTGHYWFTLANFLNNENIKIVLVQPSHVKRSKEFDDNLQTKNDLKDPKVIAKLVIDGRYSLPYIPNGIYAEIRELDNLKDRITVDIGTTKNRIQCWIKKYFPEYNLVYSSLEAVSGLIVLKSFALPKIIVEKGVDKVLNLWKNNKIRAVGIKKATQLVNYAKISIGLTNCNKAAEIEIRLLIEELEDKQKKLKDIIEELEKLVKNIPIAEELIQIKGIGINTVISFLAEVGDIARFSSPKKLQKYAGLALVENSSGKRNGKSKISKRGRKKLRTLLFKVAIPLVGKNEEFASIYNYYLKRNNNPLKKKQALIVICCKLIRIFYVILTQNIKYDKNKLLSDIQRKDTLFVA